jgi:hypothetical protein
VTQIASYPAGRVVTGGGNFTPLATDPPVSVVFSDWGASDTVPDFWSVTNEQPERARHHLHGRRDLHDADERRPPALKAAARTRRAMTTP